MIKRAYKFQLCNSKKLRKLYQYAGSCRYVWNKALNINLDLLKSGDKIHNYQSFCKLLTSWKNEDDLTWLKSSNAQGLQQCLKDLDRAFKDAFDKKQPLKRLPVVKSRNKGIGSFRIPVAPKLKENKVFIPKVGWCKFHKSQEIIGKMKNYTVSEKAGKWYISIQVEVEQEEKIHPLNSEIGIYVGISKHAVLSDGTIFKAPDFSKMEQDKKELQQELSRRKKFGSNWKKTKRKLAKLSSKIARVRNDYLHKTSSTIAKNHSYIVIEDLKVSEMSKSAKGTIETPGTKVKQKAKLNKAILDQGWFEFRRQLEYKSLWNGGFFKAVDPQYTSQMCSQCGHVDKNNRTSQANFNCMACGHSENADLNAAKNILRLGHQPPALAS